MDHLHHQAPSGPVDHSVSRAMRRELLEVAGGEEDPREGVVNAVFFFFSPIVPSKVFFFVNLKPFGRFFFFPVFVWGGGWGGGSKSDKNGMRWAPSNLFCWASKVSFLFLGGVKNVQ